MEYPDRHFVLFDREIHSLARKPMCKEESWEAPVFITDLQNSLLDSHILYFK